MRTTNEILLPSVSPGCSRKLLYHTYGAGIKRAYIQASLHADELPGLLVAQHLVKMLDKAIAANAITGEIVIVPFANPIGLSQSMMDVHLGRFSFETVTNFNRSWPDLGRQVAKKVASRLSASDSEANVAIIRSAIVESVASWEAVREEEALKKELFALSAVSDIVLDLHCDDNALLHMYTHTRLWPQLESLSAAIQSHCQLLAPCSGGHPFDEACSGIWSYLQDQFPQAAIPMACESATIELRGLYDVDSAVAEKDARNILFFLQQRGYIKADFPLQVNGNTALLRAASPLTGVDMIAAPVCGVVQWHVSVGQEVIEGELLAEIISVDNVDATPMAIRARCSGLVFARRWHHLVRPGQVVLKIASPEPLAWRKDADQLLTL